MSWSTVAPKENGIYWYRASKKAHVEIIEITNANCVLKIGTNKWHKMYDDAGEYWDVPITPPNEVKV